MSSIAAGGVGFYCFLECATDVTFSHLIEPRVEDDKHGKTSDLFGWASNFGSVRGNPLPLQPEK